MVPRTAPRLPRRDGIRMLPEPRCFASSEQKTAVATESITVASDRPEPREAKRHHRPRPQFRNRDFRFPQLPTAVGTPGAGR